MKMLKTLIIPMIILILSVPAMAQRQKQGMNHKKEHRMRGPANGLNLSDTQKKDIKEIMLNNQKVMLPLRNKMREKRAELHSLTTGDQANFDAAKKIAGDMGNLITQMMDERLSTRKKVRDLLSEQQRLKFDTHKFGFNKRDRKKKIFKHRRRG